MYIGKKHFTLNFNVMQPVHGLNSYCRLTAIIVQLCLILPLYFNIFSQHDTTFLVWSWNDQDPPVNGVPARHTMQGSAVANLLGGLTNPPQNPPDAQNFTIGVNNVRFNIITIGIITRLPHNTYPVVLSTVSDHVYIHTCRNSALLLIVQLCLFT